MESILIGWESRRESCWLGSRDSLAREPRQLVLEIRWKDSRDLLARKSILETPWQEGRYSLTRDLLTGESRLAVETLVARESRPAG